MEENMAKVVLVCGEVAQEHVLIAFGIHLVPWKSLEEAQKMEKLAIGKEMVHFQRYFEEGGEMKPDPAP